MSCPAWTLVSWQYWKIWDQTLKKEKKEKLLSRENKVLIFSINKRSLVFTAVSKQCLQPVNPQVYFKAWVGISWIRPETKIIINIVFSQPTFCDGTAGCLVCWRVLIWISVFRGHMKTSRPQQLFKTSETCRCIDHIWWSFIFFDCSQHGRHTGVQRDLPGGQRLLGQYLHHPFCLK